MAYHFYLDGLELPIPPSSLRIAVDSRNETLELMSDQEINLLRGPGLITVDFDFLVPQHQYPFAGALQPVEVYYDKLRELKEERRAFQFIVSRTSPRGAVLFDTNLTMALEDFEQLEDAEEGFDVIYAVKLRQYKPYGTKAVEVVNQTIQASATEAVVREAPDNSGAVYVVKTGDALKHIAARMLGSDKRWREIYALNKEAIEATARARGLESSREGYWIFPGQELIIP